MTCPLWLLDREPTEEEIAEHANDLGCGESQFSGSFWSSSALYPSAGAREGVLTDDGSAFAIIVGDEVPELAENLAAGRVPSAGYSSVWQDGNVRLHVEGSGSDDGASQATVLPGARVEGRLTVLHNMILPLSLLDQLEVDLDVVPHAVVAQPSARWTEAQEAELATAVRGISDEMAVSIERLPERDVSLTVLLFVGSAGLLALAATWIASGLAAVESRADLATLSAVGASPRVRRRVAGLQSGFLTLTGVLPGIAGGLAVGWAFVTASAGLGTEMPDPTWRMAVPWTVLAAAVVVLPLLAGGATALFTPSRLPLTRRPAE
ncbi:MAG: ABC transporter permease [Actinomycetales bacterium]|nr:ABC transporter permease [Actinomycetales bacterium]